MNSPVLTVIFNIVTQTVNPLTIIGLIILLICFSHAKLQLANFMIHFSFFVWVMSMTKIFFSDPRPFWLTQDIKMLDWTCYQEFGNPSGHAMMGPIFFEFVFIEYIFPLAKNTTHKIIWIAVEILFIIVLVYSRLYLGMHGLNQILLGLALGLVIIVLYRIFINKFLNNLIQKIITTQNKQKALFIIISLFMGMLALTIGFFLIEDKVVVKKPEYITKYAFWREIIDKQCTHRYKLLKSFHYKCFLDSSCIAVMFAIPVILLLSQHKEFFTGKYVGDDTILRRFRNFFIMLITALPGIAIDLVVPVGQDAILKFIVQVVSFFTSVILYGLLSPQLLIKLNCIQIPQEQEQVKNQMPTKQADLYSLKKSLVGSNIDQVDADKKSQ